jgi:hypothetical protein
MGKQGVIENDDKACIRMWVYASICVRYHLESSVFAIGLSNAYLFPNLL